MDRGTRIPAITRARREVELIAATTDLRGAAGLGLAVTVSRRGEGILRREVFVHGAAPEDLARAFEAAAAWIRRGLVRDVKDDEV